MKFLAWLTRRRDQSPDLDAHRREVEVRIYECPKGCALGKQRHFGVPPQPPVCFDCGAQLKLKEQTTTQFPP